MERPADPSFEPVDRALEREFRFVREAISMVASGAAPRVVVGGLRFPEAMLPAAHGLAAAAGVRLVPLWLPDHAGVDVAVERITPY